MISYEKFFISEKCGDFKFMYKFFKNIFLILSAAILLLTGCAEKSVDNKNPDTIVESENYDFIFVCPFSESEYWEICAQGMKRADKELGTSTKIIGPSSADNFTSEIIEYMYQAIAEQPDGIMAYSGIEGMFPLIDEAVKKGIPVVSVDSDAPETTRSAYVGVNDYNLGYNAGELMVELTGGTAKIGIMVSSFSAEREMRVISSFEDAVADYDIEIVAYNETDAVLDNAVEKTHEMLESNPEISAIFSTASCNVTGAARVKKELDRDDLILIGFDDTEENLQFTQEGIIDALLVQQVEQMGYQSVYIMKELVDGSTLARENYDTGSIIFNKENIDEYYAQDKDPYASHGTVKIGYYNSNSAFQDGYSDSERKSGYAYEYYQGIAGITGWEYEYVYGNREEIMNKLISGEIDIVAGVYKTDFRAQQVLFSERDMKIDGESRYFAVNPDRQDLLYSLDLAMEQLLKSKPDFEIVLQQKYYHKYADEALTNAEREWLDGKTLKIGYVRYNLPFSDMDDDGQPTGIAGEIIEYLHGYLDVDIEPVAFESMPDMEESLSNGELNAIFPTYSDLWRNESKGFMQTESFLTDRIMIVYRGSYTKNLMDRVAVSTNGLSRKDYPNSEIIYYDTHKELFDAIDSGKERCAVGCASVIQRFLTEHPEYDDFNIAYLESIEKFGIAVNYENSRLANILNKAIRQINEATMTSELIHYSSVEPAFTFETFFRHYSWLFIIIMILFTAGLSVFFIDYRRKTRIFNERQARTQAELEKALESANTANQAKTTFLSSMSHDIRTPMNAIVGMTSIAENHINDSERVRDCLKKINISSHHLLTLINDVLDISKIESGNLALNPVVFSLRDMMTTLESIVRPQYTAKSLDFSINIHNIEYETICADEVRLNQIFINILTNAIKYTQDKGRVSVDLSQEILQDGQNVRIIYIVRDNGIGMSSKFMKNMYNTFSRAQDSRINKIQGTGLGLTIVKQIVDMMNGSIDCKSEVNKGTEFTIMLDLPFVEKKHETDKQSDSSGKSSDKSEYFRGMNLLVAEDNELNWEVVSELLSMYDITCEHAENGRICVDMLESAEEGRYDAVLMDIQMPVMNGREAATVIRLNTHNWIKEIPIIAMTADAFAEDIAACKAVGMNGHVSKPIDLDNLFQEMYKIMNSENNVEIG